jgi:TM2 domain-containing membrane protein YozV
MNNPSTGIPKLDAALLIVSWLFAFVTLSALPMILSCIASAFVIYNQYSIYKKNKNVGEDK